jgi:hypothetical protein
MPLTNEFTTYFAGTEREFLRVMIGKFASFNAKWSRESIIGRAEDDASQAPRI